MPRVAGERDFADRRVTQSQLRFVFLDVVREEVPEVLATLFDMLPVYREAETARLAAGLHRYWRSEDGLRHAEERTYPGASAPFKLPAWEALCSLQKRLVAWAAGYDLTDPNGARNRWVLETALETLSMWNGHGYFVPRLEWWHPGVSGSYPLSDADRHFAGLPLSPGARPTLQEALEVAEDERRSGVPDLLQETRAQAERRLMALGIPREQIRAELARLAGALDTAGAVPTETLQTREADPARFFRWLAEYVCGKVDHIELANEGPERAKTIARDCRRLARLLDLKLPERRGKRSIAAKNLRIRRK